MFGLILLGLAVASGLGGWFIGDMKRRRGWAPLLWILLPLWLYLPLSIPAVILGGVRGLFEWLVLLAMLGFSMAAWAIPAAIGFAVARFGDRTAEPLRAP